MSNSASLTLNLNKEIFLRFHAHCAVATSPEDIAAFFAKLCTLLQIHTVDQRIFIEDQSITIAEIRALKGFLNEKPFASHYKIVCLWGEKLTLEAQQALLKIVEEPPPNSLIVLGVTNEDVLLPTITSRSHVFVLHSTKIKPLTTEAESQSRSFWLEFAALSPGKRLQLTTEIGTTREAVATWIHQQILFFRQELFRRYTQKEYTKLPLDDVQTLKTLSYFARLTKNNIQPKMLLDQLFLHLEYP